MPADLIQEMEILVQGLTRPDLTLIFDVQADLGLKRAHRRSKPDRFEREELEFFNRVRECYLMRANAFPDRCKLIDASQKIGKVQNEVKNLLEQFVVSQT